MTSLIDSDQIINYLKGIPSTLQLMQTLAPAGLAMSPVSHAEVMAGMYGATNPARAEAGYRNLLRDVVILPLTEAIAEEYGRTYFDLKRRGMLIDVPDMLIAATALNHHRTIVTENRRDFGRITNLVLHTP